MKNWPWYGSLIVVVLIFLLAWFFYFKPEDTKLSTLRADRIKLEQEVETLKQKKKELDKIEAELASMSVVLKQLQAIIPQRKEIASILRQIQQLAYDARLEITSFTPQGETNKEFYAEWAIPIEITGNYHNLGVFFDRLSRFARLFTVDRFGIRALTGQTDLTTIGANFTAKTYIFLEEPPAKAPVQSPNRRTLP